MHVKKLENKKKMSEKIKIDFEKKAFENDNLKFENAVELLNLIDIEFTKINIPIDKEQLLLADDIQGFILDEYWNYAKVMFPQGINPLKALQMTDFDIKNVVSYVIELRSLSKVFLIKANHVISKIDQENYCVYCSKDKEDEFNIINNIINELSKIDKNYSWHWHFQKVLGHEKITIIGDKPTPSTYYFSH